MVGIRRCSNVVLKFIKIRYYTNLHRNIIIVLVIRITISVDIIILPVAVFYVRPIYVRVIYHNVFTADFGCIRGVKIFRSDWRGDAVFGHGGDE